MKCLLNQEFTDFELTSFFFSFYLNYSKFICTFKFALCPSKQIFF